MSELKNAIIIITAKRWFDKVYGNTYHSVEVFLNSSSLGKIDFRYGYDSAYLETALEILQNAGIFKRTKKTLASGANEDSYNFRMDMRNNKDKYLIFVNDVERKRDL